MGGGDGIRSYFGGVQSTTHPVVPELKILKVREVGKKLKDVSILERVGEPQ